MQGVTLPPVLPQKVPATFGFVNFAEKMNSRAAMVRASPCTEHYAATGIAVLKPCPPPSTVALHCPSTKVALYSVAQIGFFALLALEGVMGKGILELLGVATGKGLNLQF